MEAFRDLLEQGVPGGDDRRCVLLYAVGKQKKNRSDWVLTARTPVTTRTTARTVGPHRSIDRRRHPPVAGRAAPKDSLVVDRQRRQRATTMKTIGNDNKEDDRPLPRTARRRP
jgi:hypothetical protein